MLALKKWADNHGFLSVWMEVDLYFGLAELHFSDLYLLATEAVERAMLEIGLSLPKEELEAVTNYFAEITREDKETRKSELSLEADAELGAGIPIIGKFVAKFRSNAQGSSEHLQTVRRKIRQDPDTLIAATNRVLQTANKLLVVNNRAKGLLLLFDNLDRYETPNIKALLLDGATLVRKMAAHVVYTMPINLHYGPDSAYQDYYGGPAHVLPMLALRQQNADWKTTVTDSPYKEEAVDEMLKALNRRIEVAMVFENVEDARLMIRMSGGCMRDLLHLVGIAFQKSFTDIDSPPTRLTSEGVHHAIAQYRNDLTAGLLPEHYKGLALIADCKAESQIQDENQLLKRRVLLRYKDADNPWIDVHPLVIETKGFQDARSASSPIALR